MSKQLPVYVDPLRLAEAGQVLKGQVAVSAMPRLVSALRTAAQDVPVSAAQGMVDADLTFGVDGQGIRYVRGSLRTELAVICQRCLQPMMLPLRVDIALGMAHTLDETERLPAEYEPLMLEAESQPQLLASIIEDELLLALPVAPVHVEAAPGFLDGCGATSMPGDGPLMPATEAVQEDFPAEGKRRPFAILAQLKKAGKSTH